MEIEYFGTSLTAHGHYRWSIDEDGRSKNIGLRRDDLPFDPEGLTKNLNKGQTSFYQGGGYTVIAIAGSPVDTRGGTKSVFWTKKEISKEEFVSILRVNPFFNSIIGQMPFEVQLEGL